MVSKRNLDLFPFIQGWNYNRENTSTRIITDLNGKKKLQLRVDLGLLQMELEDRPDGKRPYGRKSILDYFKHRLQKAKQIGREPALTNSNCDALCQEAIQYYHRYLAFFHMGYYDRVIQDTEHNIEIFKMIASYAENEDDYVTFLQFYPLVLFIHGKASALQAIKAGYKSTAIDAIDETILDISDFLKQNDLEIFINEIPEITSLTELRKKIIAGSRELSDYDKLNEKLRRAIAFENYEEAALIRDKLLIIKKQQRKIKK